MYGDIYVNDLGRGYGVDVSIDLGNGKVVKVYTDRDTGVSVNESLSFDTHFVGTKIWSKP